MWRDWVCSNELLKDIIENVVFGKYDKIRDPDDVVDSN